MKFVKADTTQYTTFQAFLGVSKPYTFEEMNERCLYIPAMGYTRVNNVFFKYDGGLYHLVQISHDELSSLAVMMVDATDKPVYDLVMASAI